MWFGGCVIQTAFEIRLIYECSFQVVEMSAPTAGGTAADSAYKILRDRLTLLEIPPNMPINDLHIAAELGTGRTPIREALKRLEQDRLVVSYPRRGTFTTNVDVAALGDITEIRVQLEPLAAGRAARLASPAQRGMLVQLAAEAKQLDSPDELTLIAMDMRIHRAIYKAAGNSYLEDILVEQDVHARRIWCMFRGRIPVTSLHMDAHSELIDAIVAGSDDLAAEITRRHVLEFEESIRKLI